MSENKIQDAIRSIEPQAGAKERMYQNILQKAQLSAPTDRLAGKGKKPAGFLRYALPVVACFCLILVGVAGAIPKNTPAAPKGENTQIPNPVVEVDGAAAFRSICITLDAPAGAQNVQYAIINSEIAQVQFELDGKSYTARASARSDDFSGLYGSEEEPETIDAGHNAVLSVVQIDDSQYYKVVWTDGTVNYCLYGTDGVDGAQIQAAYEAIAK